MGHWDRYLSYQIRMYDEKKNPEIEAYLTKWKQT